MTYQRFALSRQLIAEERVGKAVRRDLNAEDEAFHQATKALQRIK